MQGTRRHSFNLPLDRLPEITGKASEPRLIQAVWSKLELVSGQAAASRTLDGQVIKQGPEGDYLAASDDSRLWLPVTKQSGSHLSRGKKLRLTLSHTSIHLDIKAAARRLSWTEEQVRNLQENSNWIDCVVARVNELSRIFNTAERLKGSLKEAREVLAERGDSGNWDPQLTDEDLLKIAQTDFDDSQVQELSLGQRRFLVYRRSGSLRVFHPGKYYMKDERSRVQRGRQFGSPGRRACKMVPRQLPAQVAALQNGYEIVKALNPDNNQVGIQRQPATPRRLQARDGEFLVHFCHDYNRQDLLEVTAPGSDWWDLEIKEKLWVCVQLLKGLAHIHSDHKASEECDKQGPVRHGDLKLENCLSEKDERYRADICDFDGAHWRSDLRAIFATASWGLTADYTIDFKGLSEKDREILGMIYQNASLDNLPYEDVLAAIELVKTRNFDEFWKLELARDVRQMAALLIDALTGQPYGIPVADGMPRFVDEDELARAKKALQGCADTPQMQPCDVQQARQNLAPFITVLLRMGHPNWRNRLPAGQASQLFAGAYEMLYG